MQSSLVGSISERTAPTHSKHSPSPPQLPAGSQQQHGFPIAQHRSKGKSAFARRKEEGNRTAGPSRSHCVPSIVPYNRPFSPPKIVQHDSEEDSDDWRSEMSRQNELRVASMTDEEREKEKQELLEHFGMDVGAVLRKVKEARENARKTDKDKGENMETSGSEVDPNAIHLPEVPITQEAPSRSVSPPLATPLQGSLSTNTSRPTSPTRTSRKLRFAQLSPDDVHVYESAPSSPRKKATFALPPPPANGADEGIVSLGSYNGRLLEQKQPENEPEEGTPEDIRRRFFPSAPAANPDLAWMMSSVASEKPAADASPLDGLRFDLSGSLVPASQSLILPTHLGLHHHAEGSRAGYTIDDVFLLARSTVGAQRAAMLGILAGIAKWFRDGYPGADDAVRKEMPSKALPLLKRILFAGLELLPERGSVGARGINVVWQCVVGWETPQISQLGICPVEVEAQLGEVELNLPGSTTTAPRPSVSALIDSIPLDTVLPQISPLINSPPDLGSSDSDNSLTPNQVQLLTILHRLAKHSAATAEFIVSTPRLIAGIVNTFLLRTETPLPDALSFLITLAAASRTNAQTLCDPADALLKFVAISPPPLGLLTGTLRLYTVFAKYGLYAHCATDAQELWMRLGKYITTIRHSRRDDDLWAVEAYVGLLEAWIVCATDPHQTSPEHDITWSRVVAWGWGEDLLDLNPLNGEDLETTREQCVVQGAIWKGLAAYLEGARVNGVRAGEAEREAALRVLKPDFEMEAGTGRKVLLTVLHGLRVELLKLKDSSPSSLPYLLRASQYASVLAAVLRLSVACSPSAPAFDLPIPQISELCATVVTHSLWSLPDQQSLSGLYAGVLCRPFSALLAYYLQFARVIPGSSSDSWLAQAFAVIPRLRSGDEDFARDVIAEVLKTINREWAQERGLAIPREIWDRGGLEILVPLIQHVVQPSEDIRVAPLVVTPRSLKDVTTLRLPTNVLLTTEWHPSGLPLHRDWTLTPIDQVLRSGHEASAFKRKGLFPDSWDASETDIVRASLLLTKLAGEVVRRFAKALVKDVCVGRSEVVLGCMKVFMLEHAQDHDRGAQEVFRDGVVGQLMEHLVAPFSFGAGHREESQEEEADLEAVSSRFLGQAVPFFQYYTDFVALYDAISFAHPLFTRLLLPPTSMRYAVDYRKHLWVDFGHLIKTMHVPVEAVIVGDMKEYLYPLETNGEMIGAYLGALMTGAVAAQGFMRLVALHHVAMNVWMGDEEVGQRLFGFLVKGKADLVREVVRYRQKEGGEVLMPPHCFGWDVVGEEKKDERVRRIRAWSDTAEMAERIVDLLDS